MKQAADLRAADANECAFSSDATNDEQVKVETTASRRSKGGEESVG